MGRILGRPDFKDRVFANVPIRFNYGLGRLDDALNHASKRLSGAKFVLRNCFRNIDVTAFFIRFSEARFLLLDRQSAVDAMCNFQIARLRRTGHSERPQSDPKPFVIPIEGVERWIRTHLLRRRLVRALLASTSARFLEISYERLMADTPGTLAEIAGFLGVSPLLDRSRLKGW